MQKMQFIAIFAASLAIAPAVAQAAQPVDNYGASAIRSANYTLAEQRLAERLAIAPADQTALLNLGYVYRHTDRLREANSAYFRVLSRSNVMLTASDGRPVWSHDLARAGLSGQVSIATR